MCALDSQGIASSPFTLRVKVLAMTVLPEGAFVRATRLSLATARMRLPSSHNIPRGEALQNDHTNLHSTCIKPAF